MHVIVAPVVANFVTSHTLSAAGGVVPAKRAAFECGNDDCRAAVWQRPQDLVLVGAWPATLDTGHFK